MRAFSRVLSTAVCFFMLFTMFASTPLARADALDDKYDELASLQKEIEEYKRQLSSRQQTEKSVLQELDYLEKQIALADKELAYISTRMTYLNKDIAETTAAINTIEEQLAAQKEAFEARLTSMYKAGTVSYLEVLFQSESLTDFMARIHYLREIAQQDSLLIEEYNAGRKELMNKKATLQINLADLEGQKRDYENKRFEVASRSQDRERYLAQIQADKKALERSLDEMEAQSKALEEEIRRLQAQSSLGARELKMIWPASGGWISSPYGWREHPVLGYDRFHSGVDYAANTNSPILAAESGVVILAGSNGGYGLCVIIDHGGGISTLYGHANKLLVSKGDQVIKGQKIALVGSTGLSTGPHLHFEVRVNGETRNPLDWCKP